MDLVLHSLLTALLLWYCEGIKAAATISPPERASACIGDDQLELTCNITGNFLKWSINLFSSSSTGYKPYSRILSTLSENTYLQVNNTLFTFSRISPQNSLPLESVLLISPVNQHLNGTVVNCTDTTSEKSSSTVIITNLHPEINVTLLSEQFESDGVVVTLEWAHWNTYLYNVSVTPLLLELAYSDITRINFNVSYNTHYSVNITALSPCGVKLSTSIALQYVICGDPINMTDNSSKNLMITTHHRAPNLKGTHVYFNCPPGLLLSGPNSSTCMGNGKWEPILRDMECKAMQMEIRQGLGSLSQSVQIIIISVAVYIICSSLFFAVGLLCHRFCPKQKQLNESDVPTVTKGQENTQHRQIMHVAIEQVELTDNAAYNTVQLCKK